MDEKNKLFNDNVRTIVTVLAVIGSLFVFFISQKNEIKQYNDKLKRQVDETTQANKISIENVRVQLAKLTENVNRIADISLHENNNNNDVIKLKADVANNRRNIELIMENIKEMKKLMLSLKENSNNYIDMTNKRQRQMVLDIDENKVKMLETENKLLRDRITDRQYTEQNYVKKHNAK